ncbi:zinc finger and BTB domain-containing protein 6-like isoform X1 [Neodiprion fabricii]|uniref:zinc finger and BTB domain-containing protein 6-like isoform X1 n=1 Tax=Neodiprion fabricii TaxID=2872261 RepID=UPI001ED97E6A|nr:zinc finger and BTB domain-containing protein 6-like isoform X1 [Neodiprion fabricii]
MSGEQFSLVWNSFPTNLSSGLYTLLNDEQLVDVTLAAEGQFLQAHKLILSVCSTYFKELFKMNSCKHPIVILKDVNYRDLSALLHFMYQGEVRVKQEDLASFLKVAETLQIKGLTKDKSEKDNSVTDNNVPTPGENHQEQSRELESILEAVSNLERKSLNDETFVATLQEEIAPIPETTETLNSSQDPVSPPPMKSVYDKASDQRRITQPDSIVRDILNRTSEDFQQMEENVTDEPLDYTSDIARLSKTKNEPVDYTSDIDFDLVCNKEFAKQENLDRQNSNLHAQSNLTANKCFENSQLLTYNPSNQDEPLPFSHLEETFGTDFSFNGGNYSRGRKTVKGIPGSSLPLETTLRVVSELGPTIRVERGKVIRMYSCPWCLRHFTRKENLKLHVRYIHGPLESLTCKLCGNKYKNSNSLRVHSYLYHNAKRNKHSKPAHAGM